MNLDEALEKLRAAREPVPKPLRLPTPEEVDAAERDVGVAFHPDYRRFQLEVSNVVAGVLEPAVVLPNMMPYLDLRRTVETARKVGVPDDVLPFCQDNGNYFFIDRAGRVGYWDHDDRTASPRHASLADWIVEEWLGDADEAG
ncbi:MAG: hypothetical protein JWO31_3011 [Phycisphaerales bacterium]|nr:hypothetical protein [Phycisphaerales bacterium]